MTILNGERTAADLTADAIERALSQHSTDTPTTCLIAVAVHGHVTAVTDLFGVESRTNKLRELGADVDDPHGTVRWAIAFCDTEGNLRVLGHGSKLKEWTRINFHAFSLLGSDELEVA